MNVTRPLGSLALVAAIAAALAAVALAQRDQDTTPTVAPRLGEPGTVHPPPIGASKQIQRRLGVFRRAMSSDDQTSYVDPAYARANGINVGQSRRVQGTGTFVVQGAA